MYFKSYLCAQSWVYNRGVPGTFCPWPLKSLETAVVMFNCMNPLLFFFSANVNHQKMVPSANHVKLSICCSAGLAGAKYISFEERQWHSECFTCLQCSVSLVGRGFLTQRDNILCTDCGREK